MMNTARLTRPSLVIVESLEARLLYQTVTLRRVEICVHHLTNQGSELDLGRPSKLKARLARVAQQCLDLGGAEIPGVDLHDHIARLAARSCIFHPRDNSELLGVVAFKRQRYSQFR